MVEDLLQNSNLPFTDRMMKFHLPEKFNVPHVQMYNGAQDPTKHFEAYQAHLKLHGTPDEIT